MNNKIRMCGFDFVEFCETPSQDLEKLFLKFGFSKIKKHSVKNIDYFNQHDIHFFLNKERHGVSQEFAQKHGPAICSMGWRFNEPQEAFQLALARGARAAIGDLFTADGKPVPAVYGLGDMLIYFMKATDHADGYQRLGFVPHSQPVQTADKGFLSVDHLTNNVFRGTMDTWATFYRDVFEFTQVRYFDIRGAKTGLASFALRSPCGNFCIPINEGTESKSQINEYLEKYNGPGVQHLAFLTKDILSSLDALRDSTIETLDIDDQYYSDIFQKFPQVKENHEKIRQHNVLVDGDDEGYLLQIFTKDIIGPIFIEIIQRNNHLSFGEGNFGALFRSIERDQMKRGYLS